MSRRSRSCRGRRRRLGPDRRCESASDVRHFRSEDALPSAVRRRHHVHLRPDIRIPRQLRLIRRCPDCDRVGVRCRYPTGECSSLPVAQKMAAPRPLRPIRPTSCSARPGEGRLERSLATRGVRGSAPSRAAPSFLWGPPSECPRARMHGVRSSASRRRTLLPSLRNARRSRRADWGAQGRDRTLRGSRRLDRTR